MVVIAQHLNAEQEGYAMYFLSKSLEENPYEKDCEDYYKWSTGWARGFVEDCEVVV